MENSRFERLAPLTGAVSAVLLVAGGVMIGNYTYLPPADEVVDFFTNSATRIAVGSYLGMLSAFFLLWFAGSIRTALGEQAGDKGRLSAIAFGGGVASAVVVASGNIAILYAAQRAGTSDGISAAGAVTLLDLGSGLFGNVLPITLAAMVGAIAIVSLRMGTFPAWFGWVSGVLALAMLSPYGWAAITFGLVWVLVVSVWLYVRGASSAVPSASGDVVAGTA